jgi:hypothetical protein
MSVQPLLDKKRRYIEERVLSLHLDDGAVNRHHGDPTGSRHPKETLGETDGDFSLAHARRLLHSEFLRRFQRGLKV